MILSLIGIAEGFGVMTSLLAIWKLRHSWESKQLSSRALPNALAS
jgi:hypothetical protein